MTTEVKPRMTPHHVPGCRHCGPTCREVHPGRPAEWCEPCQWEELMELPRPDWTPRERRAATAGEAR